MIYVGHTILSSSRWLQLWLLIRLLQRQHMSGLSWVVFSSSPPKCNINLLSGLVIKLNRWKLKTQQQNNCLRTTGWQWNNNHSTFPLCCSSIKMKSMCPLCLWSHCHGQSYSSQHTNRTEFYQAAIKRHKNSDMILHWNPQLWATQIFPSTLFMINHYSPSTWYLVTQVLDLQELTLSSSDTHNTIPRATSVDLIPIVGWTLCVFIVPPSE